MTEAEWLACTDPAIMLSFLLRQNSLDIRKIRLWAVACVERISHLLRHPQSRRAIELARSFADGGITIGELGVAARDAEKAEKHPSEAVNEGDLNEAFVWAAWAAYSTACFKAEEIVLAANSAANATTLEIALIWGSQDYVDRFENEERAQCCLIRELFGTPTRPMELKPLWLHWNDRTVVRLAQAIYDEGRFADLPILVDALEDAGCDNAEMLAHCRGLGPHVRGCWVVDTLLGKS